MALNSAAFLTALVAKLKVAQSSLEVEFIGEVAVTADAYPRLVVQGIDDQTVGNKISDETEHLVELHIFTMHRGSLKARAIADKLYDLLHRQRLTLADGCLSRLEVGAFRPLGQDPEVENINHSVLPLSGLTKSPYAT